MAAISKILVVGHDYNKLSFSRFFFQYNNNELGEVVNEEFRNEFDKLPILNDKIQVKHLNTTFEHNF